MTMIQTPMIPERKAKLVAALRSDEFRQGKSMLFNNQTGTYCCMGVACEVYRRETGDGEWVKTEPDGASDGMGRYTRFVPSGGKGDDLVLPPKVAEWYGLEGDALTTGNPQVEHADHGIQAFGTLNDDFETPFPVIADLIDEQL